MTKYEEKQLKIEIKHIFDSGANEIRVFNMFKEFLGKHDFEKTKNQKMKSEILKELEILRDIENYSTSNLLNTGYRTAILDCIDLVKNTTKKIKQNCNHKNTKKDRLTHGWYYCKKCKMPFNSINKKKTRKYV